MPLGVSSLTKLKMRLMDNPSHALEVLILFFQSDRLKTESQESEEIL